MKKMGNLSLIDNVKLLIEQYKNSERLKGLLIALLNILQLHLANPLDEMQLQYHLEHAEGFWLDRIGDIFGYHRPAVPVTGLLYFGFEGNGTGFDQEIFDPSNGGNSTLVPIHDDLYRKLLLAWILGLFSDGSIPSINRVIQQAFGQGHIVDLGGMAAAIILYERRYDIIKTIVRTGIIVKPAGVQYVYNNFPNECFGFEGNSLGFDQAPFVLTQNDFLR